MFRIGEFSKLTQVSVRMLRHYDKMGLLTPAATDRWTGYRMYSVDQIPVLNKIIYLRDSGFNIAEIAVALNHDNEGFIVGELDRKSSEIRQNIRNEEAKLKKIELAKRELLLGKDEMHYHVSIKSIPGYQVLALRKIIPDYYGESELWKELCDFVEEKHLEVSEQTFAIYHDTDYREENVDVELCVLTDKTGQNEGPFSFRHTDPVPAMACTMVYGEFANISGAYLALARWLQKNSRYTMGSSTRQIVHRGPWNEENPDRYLTEIQIPLEEQGS